MDIQAEGLAERQVVIEPVIVDLTQDDDINEDIVIISTTDFENILDSGEGILKDNPKKRKLSENSNEPVTKKSIRNKAFTCSICLEQLEEINKLGQTILSTSCGHVFCEHCLKKSLRRNRFCPTCRKHLSKRQFHPLYL